MPRVVIDRTTSEVPLSLGLFRKGENGTGFGLLEQWIAKLNCYTIRQEGKASFSADVVVVICPTLKVSPDFHEGLVRYVKDGGKLLVFDSPENKSSAANDLLSPFGIKIDRNNPSNGTLTLKGSWPNIPATACSVSGGEAIAQINGKPVATVTHVGKGTVMVVGFGNLFNDRNMGYTWMFDPDTQAKQRFNAFYALVRSLLRNKPIEPTRESFGEANKTGTSSELPANGFPEPQTPLQLPDLPTKEMGPKE
jgi:hypothetical protein